MFGWARRLVSGGARPGEAVRTSSGQRIRARYDNAQTTKSNERNWFMADYMSSKAANSFQVRRQLRMRSRYEVSNNPFLFGITDSNARDLIATGPTLEVATSDAAYNRQVENAFNEWAAEVALTEKLRTLKLAKTVDGEGFLVLKTVDDLYNSVKLYPVDVEADQVTTPMPATLSDFWVDGLVLHPVTGRPIAYHVLKHHPGDLFFPDFNPLAVDKISAKHVVHWFKKFRPGQVRGIPVFTSSLDLFAELRAFRKAVLNTAQNQAQFTAVLEMMAPADTSGLKQGEPFDHIPIDRGMMTTTPAGAKLRAFDTSQPAATYEMFQEKCLGEACRPLEYPLNLALGSSQKFNFSSARLDHINYREGLTVERDDGEVVALDPITAAWFDEAVRIPKLLPNKALELRMPHRWHWPGFPMLDVQKETEADLARIAGGTLTWQEFWAKRGKNWIDVMAQQKREKDEIEKLGLVFGEPLKKQERVDIDDPEQAGVADG